MKKTLLAAAMLMLIATQLHAASDSEKSEAITTKMAVKCGRGLINIATSPLEIPRQIATMTKDYGFPGTLLGPFSGILMTGYRALIGTTETVFFMVPAPGYYDNMMDPEFVWVGWNSKQKKSELAVTEVEEELP